MTSYIIIGNGVAGVRAAEMIRKHDAKGQVTLVSDETYPFYYRPQMVEFISGKVEEGALWAKPADFYEANRFTLLAGKKVTSVSPKKHTVTLSDRSQLKYDRLLIATGGAPVLPDFSGVEWEGVLTLKTLDDARKIKNAVKGATSAVVIGEGLYGLVLARAFRESGLKVTCLASGEWYWSKLFDAEASGIVMDHLRGRGISLVKTAEVKQIIAQDGRVSGVVTKSGETISCNLVGIGLGLKPGIAFLQDSGIKLGTGVLVDSSLKTNFPDVFAAGDVAEVPDRLSGGTQVHMGWLNAWREGQVAGANMAGESASNEHAVRSTLMQLFGQDLVALGEANGQGEGYSQRIASFPELVGVYKRLVVRDEKVVGALLLGEASESGPIEAAIRRGDKVSSLDQKLMDQMFEPHRVVSFTLGVLCPVCKLTSMLEPNAKEGDIITCPACGVNFKLVKERDRFKAVRVW